MAKCGVREGMSVPSCPVLVNKTMLSISSTTHSRARFVTGRPHRLGLLTETHLRATRTPAETCLEQVSHLLERIDAAHLVNTLDSSASVPTRMFAPASTYGHGMNLTAVETLMLRSQDCPGALDMFRSRRAVAVALSTTFVTSAAR